jgi:lipoprotein-anchoring transpeptidase ErfK/SrfK
MERRIEISLSRQRLWLKEDGEVIMDCPVSTGKNGPGEWMDSECTPRGEHAIHQKIGADCPEGTVFVARKPTGEIYSPTLREQSPPRDWILTRILWLTGLEPGKNCCGRVDTRDRYIYIHGTPDEIPLGAPGSRGCIRMRDSDIVALFERVEVGDRVVIREDDCT